MLLALGRKLKLPSLMEEAKLKSSFGNSQLVELKELKFTLDFFGL